MTQAPPPDDQYEPSYAPDNVTSITPPPHDLAAERYVLGAAIQAPTILDACTELLTPDAFYKPAHEHLWNLLVDLRDRDEPIEPQNVLATIRTAGLIKKIPGTYLFSLISETGNPLHGTHYAHQVAELAVRRKAIAILNAAKVKVENPSSGAGAHAEIADALQNLDDLVTRVGAGPNTSTVSFVPFEGLFTKPRTPVQWVIAPILAAGRVTLLYSPGKTGKSLIAMEAAAAIATGRAAIATDTPQDPAHVLYIDQEMTEDDWIDRLTDMGYGTTDEQHLNHHLHLAQLQTWEPMDTPAGGAAVEREALRTNASVVIIDTASKVIAGEENSNDTQQAFYRHTLIPLKRAGIAVLVLDHTGKDLDRGARGGSAKTDNIDLAFELLKRGKDLLTLRCTHARIRSHHLNEPTFLRRTTDPLTHQIETNAHQGTTGPGLRPTHLMEMVSRYVEANPGASRTQIETAIKGRGEYIRLALELLITESWITVERGARGVQQHRQMLPYREDEDTRE